MGPTLIGVSIVLVGLGAIGYYQQRSFWNAIAETYAIDWWIAIPAVTLVLLGPLAGVHLYDLYGAPLRSGLHLGRGSGAGSGFDLSFILAGILYVLGILTVAFAVGTYRLRRRYEAATRAPEADAGTVLVSGVARADEEALYDLDDQSVFVSDVRPASMLHGIAQDRERAETSFRLESIRGAVRVHPSLCALGFWGSHFEPAVVGAGDSVTLLGALRESDEDVDPSYWTDPDEFQYLTTLDPDALGRKLSSLVLWLPVAALVQLLLAALLLFGGSA